MRERISLELAERIAERALELSKGPISVAIYDGFGWPVLCYRHQDAPPPTYEMARDRAWTAAMFGMPSDEVSSLGDINTSNWNDRVTTSPGGFPIEVNGKLLGGLGIAGYSPEEDKKLCVEVLKDIDGL